MAAHSIAGSVKHLAGNHHAHAPSGYVATGGSLGASAIANSTASSGSGSIGAEAGTTAGTSSGLGPATGSYSGTTSGSIVGSSSTGAGSQGYSNTSGGAYTYPGYYANSASGGTYYVPPVTGKIFVSGGGGGLISGAANLGVLSQDRTATLSNISWSSSGTPVMYSSQTVPNPATATQFTQVPYAIGQQKTSTVSFYWGEKIGVETITVNADVTLNGKTVAAQPAILKIDVGSPGVSGEVTASKSGSRTQDNGRYVMQYGTARAAGVNWGGLSPTNGGGKFQIVQIINSSSTSVTPVPGGVKTAGPAHLKLGVFSPEAVFGV